jgi:glycogen(starch) synthase
MRLKKEFNLPYVITAHGSDVLGYNARFKRLYPLLVGPWKKVLDGAQTVISPSEFLKGEIRKVYPEFEGERIQVIPNGIDTSKFSPQPKKPYIFSSGRLLPNKGFQHLIAAVTDEDLGWEVHIAGDGPMRGELENLANRSRTKVVLHGWLDNRGTEYKNLLEQATLFVLASKAESYGMVLIEALCAGCKVITSKNVGALDMVRSEVQTVEFGDVQDLNAKIQKGMQTERKEINKHELEKYDWKNTIDHWSNIL